MVPGSSILSCDTFFFFFFLSILSAQPLPGSYYDFLEQTENMEVKPNPATLIIYRPENKGQMNEIRCFIRLEDEKGDERWQEEGRKDESGRL